MGKYEEALERAKQGLPLDEVFPELKESEDERIRKMLVEQMERWKKCAEDNNVEQDVKDASAALAYLEKQKEQQPAEWSEEDEKILESIVIYGALDDEQITWLKSLRPQPHWKPSEEQMEWLESAVRLSTDKPHIHGIIISLYEQLKRLL